MKLQSIIAMLFCIPSLVIAMKNNTDIDIQNLKNKFVSFVPRTIPISSSDTLIKLVPLALKKIEDSIIQEGTIIDLIQESPNQPDKKGHCPDRCRTSILPRSLATHQSKKHGTDRKACFLCNKIFSTLYALKRHHQTIHTSYEQRKYPCPNCPKHYTTQGSLNQHLRDQICHEPFESVTCPHCPFQVARICYLKYHLANTHADLAEKIKE